MQPSLLYVYSFKKYFENKVYYIYNISMKQKGGIPV